jgi:mannan endo-1,4-beta-mannosidase
VTAGTATQRSNVPGLSASRYANAFIRRQGSRLTVAGRSFRFAGANGEFLGLENYGPIPSAGQGSGRERYATEFEIDDELATLHEMGATVVRAQTIGDTVGCALCLEPSLGRFNPRAFHESDLVVAAAHRYGIKLIGEFAGDANGSAPFGLPKPGAIKGLDQSTEWYCVWHHVSVPACPTATFEDPRILADYRRHMAAVLDHVNPYTAWPTRTTGSSPGGLTGTTSNYSPQHHELRGPADRGRATIASVNEYDPPGRLRSPDQNKLADINITNNIPTAKLTMLH